MDLTGKRYGWIDVTMKNDKSDGKLFVLVEVLLGFLGLKTYKLQKWQETVNNIIFTVSISAVISHMIAVYVKAFGILSYLGPSHQLLCFIPPLVTIKMKAKKIRLLYQKLEMYLTTRDLDRLKYVVIIGNGVIGACVLATLALAFKTMIGMNINQVGKYGMLGNISDVGNITAYAIKSVVSLSMSLVMIQRIISASYFLIMIHVVEMVQSNFHKKISRLPPLVPSYIIDEMLKSNRDVESLKRYFNSIYGLLPFIWFVDTFLMGSVMVMAFAVFKVIPLDGNALAQLLIIALYLMGTLYSDRLIVRENNRIWKSTLKLIGIGTETEMDKLKLGILISNIEKKVDSHLYIWNLYPLNLEFLFSFLNSFVPFTVMVLNLGDAMK